ncbi:tyrosine-protein phosphatase [Microbacterium sp. zg-Y818]|uniref:tyrosine-protein phosphatase n=1 Tax=unclassified Microbacterium TaxID=2609290 RepID=UPI00214D12D6|nr:MULTISPECIES: tyrosine-protein phosphatase [unclassified Microbacterium]MCR2801633.1 tyrosine-protein phosphatase [Microbacterium sp. zg.Y818]WIM23095.1 tyrosine-protein phosphatase [Microbacterium sp. zg-Y818]
MTDATWAVSGALNFRDVGGLPAQGGVTRSGVLFRSGNLARLDDVGRRTLRELGLRRVIDLRADDEVALEPSLVDGLGLETMRVPLLLGSAASFLEKDIDLDGFYRAMLDEAADRVVEVVRGVLADQPVLVHCTVGKDRTGVTVGLTLAAAGVDEDAVVADYARTEALLPAQRNARVLRYLRSQHPEARFLEELATKSPAAAMRTLLDDLRGRYGAPVEFLRAHGLGDDEIRELTALLVRHS